MASSKAVVDRKIVDSDNVFVVDEECQYKLRYAESRVYKRCLPPNLRLCPRSFFAKLEWSITWDGEYMALRILRLFSLRQLIQETSPETWDRPFWTGQFPGTCARECYICSNCMALTRCYRIRTLVLVGGYSSRMGSPKHLLPMPTSANDSQPLLIHLFKVLLQLSSENELVQVLTFSVRNESQRKDVENLLRQHQISTDTSVEFVTDFTSNAGPTQGLLAAYSCDKTAHWLVIACDYPFLTTNTLFQLIQAHHLSKPAVTCFQNDEGFAEPLLAIWSPSALSVLADLTGQADSAIGPNQAIKKLEIAAANKSINANQQHFMGVERVQPLDSTSIKGVNTRDEWEAVQNQLRV